MILIVHLQVELEVQQIKKCMQIMICTCKSVHPTAHQCSEIQHIRHTEHREINRHANHIFCFFSFYCCFVNRFFSERTDHVSYKLTLLPFLNNIFHLKRHFACYGQQSRNRQTDRQTDRQTERAQHCHLIHLINNNTT